MHLLQYFDKLSLKPENAKELKGLILDLAIRGRLTEEWRKENPDVASASVLLNHIKNGKLKLEKSKKIRKEKPLAEISAAEIPFEIPEGWVWCKMGELSEKLGAGSTPKGGDRSYVNNGIKFFRSKNIYNWGLKLDGVVYITNEIQIKMKNTIVRPKDILLNITGGSIGRCALMSDEFDTANVSQHVAIVRMVDLECRHFIHKLITSNYFQDTIMDVQVGVSREGLSMTKLKEFLIPLPPIAEQKSIVKIVNQLMTEVDELATQTKTRVQLRHDFIQSSLRQLTTDDSSSEWNKLQPQFTSFFDTVESIDKLKEAILQLAVQGKLTKQWRKDYPDVESASVLLGKIKEEKARLIKEKKIKKEKLLPEISEDEIPFDIPEGWVWSRFIEIASIASNLVDPSLYQQMPHIAPNVIEKNSGRLLDYKTVKEDEVISSKNLFHSGQIVYSKIRPNLNKLVMVDFEGLCSADMYPIDSYIHTEYLFRFMLSTVFLEQSVKTDTRVAMPKINQTELKKILIPVAPLTEQKIIAQSVNKLLEYCDQIKAELKDRNSFSDAFLQSSIREVMKKTQSLA